MDVHELEPLVPGSKIEVSLQDGIWTADVPVHSLTDDNHVVVHYASMLFKVPMNRICRRLIKVQGGA